MPTDLDRWTLQSVLERTELRELLARREQLLVADERAAVRAALEQATPEERERLEQLLRQPSGLRFDAPK